MYPAASAVLLICEVSFILMKYKASCYWALTLKVYKNFYERELYDIFA